MKFCETGVDNENICNNNTEENNDDRRCVIKNSVSNWQTRIQVMTFTIFKKENLK